MIHGIIKGQRLTEAIFRNPKSLEKAVLTEIDKDLLTGLVSIPARNTLPRFYCLYIEYYYYNFFSNLRTLIGLETLDGRKLHQ